MRVVRSHHNRQKRMKKASSPVKHNNQLKNGDVQEKAHGKHYRVRPKSGWLLSFGCFGRHRGRVGQIFNGVKWRKMNLLERLCHYGPDKSNGQKNDKQYQNTKLLSILQEKRKVETQCFHLMWLRRLPPNFEECRTIRESTEKKVKNTYIYFLFACEYILL